MTENIFDHKGNWSHIKRTYKYYRDQRISSIQTENYRIELIKIRRNLSSQWNKLQDHYSRYKYIFNLIDRVCDEDVLFKKLEKASSTQEINDIQYKIYQLKKHKLGNNGKQ